MNVTLRVILESNFNDWKVKIPKELQDQVFDFLEESMLFGDVDQEASVIRSEIAEHLKLGTDPFLESTRYEARIQKGLDVIEAFATSNNGANSPQIDIRNGKHSFKFSKTMGGTTKIDGYSTNPSIRDDNGEWARVGYDGYIYERGPDIKCELKMMNFESGSYEKVPTQETIQVTSYEELGKYVNQHVSQPENVQSR